METRIEVIVMTNKIKRLRIFSCASMIILSSVLVGCGNQQEEKVATDVTEEVEPQVEQEENTNNENDNEEEQTLMDQYMKLPIYNDRDRAAFEDIKNSFEGAFDTSSLEEYKEEWALKINYFKRFLQNDPNATYGGYTFSELSDEAQNKAKELYHRIDGYFSEHIRSYDEVKEKVKNGVQKALERGKNGWERFKDNEGKAIKDKAESWLDTYFPENYE